MTEIPKERIRKAYNSGGSTVLNLQGLEEGKEYRVVYKEEKKWVVKEI